MARKPKDNTPQETPLKRNFEAIARTKSGEFERYCVNNVTSLDEARAELHFQVRCLKTILFLVKP